MLALKHSIFIVSMLFYLPTAQQIGAVRLDLLSFVILRSGRVSDYTRENGILIYFTFLVTYLSFISNNDGYFSAFIHRGFIVLIPSLQGLLDNKEINLQSVH